MNKFDGFVWASLSLFPVFQFRAYCLFFLGLMFLNFLAYFWSAHDWPYIQLGRIKIELWTADLFFYRWQPKFIKSSRFLFICWLFFFSAVGRFFFVSRASFSLWACVLQPSFVRWVGARVNEKAEGLRHWVSIWSPHPIIFLKSVPVLHPITFEICGINFSLCITSPLWYLSIHRLLQIVRWKSPFAVGASLCILFCCCWFVSKPSGVRAHWCCFCGGEGTHHLP